MNCLPENENNKHIMVIHLTIVELLNDSTAPAKAVSRRVVSGCIVTSGAADLDLSASHARPSMTPVFEHKTQWAS